MENNKIKQFLYEVYGFAKLEEFLNRNKPKEMKLKEFLQETIIGTYVGSMPGIPKIRTTQEIKDESFKLEKTFYCINDNLLYHLRCFSFFRVYRENQVRDFLNPNITRIFGEELKYSKEKRKWEYNLTLEEFNLSIIGSAPNNAKNLILDFNLEENIKNDINELVRRYHIVYSLPRLKKNKD